LNPGIEIIKTKRLSQLSSILVRYGDIIINYMNDNILIFRIVGIMREFALFHNKLKNHYISRLKDPNFMKYYYEHIPTTKFMLSRSKK